MLAEHSADARHPTPDQLAKEKRESEIALSRMNLVLGGVGFLVGLGMTLYGAYVYSILTCPFTSMGPCVTPQYLVDQLRTDGFRAVYVGAQETAYGGMLLLTFGSMGVAFWAARGLQLSQKTTLALLVGIFLLVLVTALAIAAGFIPFGQRIVFPQ